MSCGGGEKGGERGRGDNWSDDVYLPKSLLEVMELSFCGDD